MTESTYLNGSESANLPQRHSCTGNRYTADLCDASLNSRSKERDAKLESDCIHPIVRGYAVGEQRTVSFPLENSECNRAEDSLEAIAISDSDKCMAANVPPPPSDHNAFIVKGSTGGVMRTIGCLSFRADSTEVFESWQGHITGGFLPKFRCTDWIGSYRGPALSSGAPLLPSVLAPVVPPPPPSSYDYKIPPVPPNNPRELPPPPPSPPWCGVRHSLRHVWGNDAGTPVQRKSPYRGVNNGTFCIFLPPSPPPPPPPRSKFFSPPPQTPPFCSYSTYDGIPGSRANPFVFRQSFNQRIVRDQPRPCCLESGRESHVQKERDVSFGVKSSDSCRAADAPALNEAKSTKEKGDDSSSLVTRSWLHLDRCRVNLRDTTSCGIDSESLYGAHLSFEDPLRFGESGAISSTQNDATDACAPAFEQLRICR